MRYRLAALTSHPIQYQAPLFRQLANHPEIELMVYFCSDLGVENAYWDQGFGIKLKWDVPLLEGYRYKFLSHLSCKPSISFFRQIKSAIIIIRELMHNRYDGLWVHGYIPLTNWFAFSGAWIAKTPILLRGESHLPRTAFKVRCLRRIILPLFFKQISCFLTIGTLNAEYYKHYGVSGERLFFTPYAVNNDFFLRRSHELYDQRSRLKEELGILPEQSVILYVSKMIPQKRAKDLLLAYTKIQTRIDMALVFVGEGRERPLLEAYAKQQNLKNVYFVGFKNQTELPNYFVIADVFVLPSAYEPWGLVINEAMNFSLPIVTTDKVGAAYDLVRHGENGFIYPVGNIDKLSEYLLRILENNALKEKMGRCSLEIIAQWSYKEDVRGLLAALRYTKRGYE